MRLLIVFGLVVAGWVGDAAEVKPLVWQLMEVRDELVGIPFGEVIAANTGRKLLPINRRSSTDRRLVDRIAKAVERVMRRIADSAHPAHRQRRINEVSKYFEDALLEELNSTSGLECGYPRTAAGKIQRAGYPDLRLVDRTSGRVV